jgi:hypothetical protein
MGSNRIKSLHHNLEYQDPMIGGKNVVFHRTHRSKRGKRDHHYLPDGEYWQRIEKKDAKRIQNEERFYEKLAY